MIGTRRLALGLLLAIGAVAALPARQDAPPGPVGERQAEGPASPVRELLDSIREDLVELRFEKALAAIEALLGDPGMTETERAETLVLRAQAHVAFGDLDAAETDYREILALRPAYRPATSLTPQKALARFEKVRREMIGTVHLELEPADARLTVDGREVVLPGDGRLPLLAGEHVLRATSGGHDPVERSVTLPAGQETSVRLELVPNARTVILSTEPEDVEVLLDGRPVGRSVRPGSAYSGEPAELVIGNVPLGEHVYELRKECYRTERIRDTLTVDLLDRAPRRFATRRLAAARAILVLEGGPPSAEVAVDGRTVGRLPLEPSSLCPGRRKLEVRFGKRMLWFSTESFVEASETRLRVIPRPNVVLVGSSRWPAALEVFASGYNRRAVLPPPPATELSESSGWRGVELPPDTDLALAVLPPARQGAGERWYLYSPILRAVARLDATPTVERPAWTRSVWGFSAVDAGPDGPALVAEVTRTGPAATVGLAAGDRLVALGGRPIERTAEVRATLRAAAPASPLEVEWVSKDGAPRKGELRGAASPLLVPRHDRPEVALLRAAWAVVDAATEPELAPTALANLALLFAEYGHHELAADTWRRVRWGDRLGIGEGTKQYYLGRALQALGREDDAVQAYREAARGTATTFDDEGPAVAPAALDHLADLGRPASAR